MPPKARKPKTKKVLAEKDKKIYYGYQRPLNKDKERRPTQEQAFYNHKIMYWGLKKISDDLIDVYPVKKTVTRNINKEVKNLDTLEKSLEGHLKKVEEQLLKLEKKQKKTDQKIEVIQEEVAPEIIQPQQIIEQPQQIVQPQEIMSDKEFDTLLYNALKKIQKYAQDKNRIKRDEEFNYARRLATEKYNGDYDEMYKHNDPILRKLIEESKIEASKEHTINRIINGLDDYGNSNIRPDLLDPNIFINDNEKLLNLLLDIINNYINLIEENKRSVFGLKNKISNIFNMLKNKKNFNKIDQLQLEKQQYDNEILSYEENINEIKNQMKNKALGLLKENEIIQPQEIVQPPQIIQPQQLDPEQIINEINNDKEEIKRYEILADKELKVINKLQDTLDELLKSYKRKRNPEQKKIARDDIDGNKEFIFERTKKYEKILNEINRLKNKVQYLESEMNRPILGSGYGLGYGSNRYYRSNRSNRYIR